MKPKKIAGLKTAWDFSLIFPGPLWEKQVAEEHDQVEKVARSFAEKWKARNDHLTDPKVLAEALNEYEYWIAHHGAHAKEYYHAYLTLKLDQNNPELKAQNARIADASQKIDDELRFFGLALAKIAPEKQGKLLESPELADYHHFLERTFAEGKYLLSEGEEKIIALKSDVASHNWARMTAGFIAREERTITIGGKKVKKNCNEIISLLTDPVKKIRDQAAAAFNDILTPYEDVAENEFNAVLTNKKIDDELRGVARPDELRHLGDDIESKIVDTLVSTVADAFSVAQAYYRLKAKLLGVPKLAYHERAVPLGQVTRTFQYQEGVALVEKVLEKLDPEFGEIFRRLTRDGHLDVYPKKGKTGGAFCADGILSTPTYILLNYTDKLEDCLTLAHEVGHGINNELLRKKRHALDFGTPLVTAEVASTFMEDFVVEEILAEDPSPQNQLTIMMMRLDDDVNTIFRQIAAYRFEQELHQTFRQKGYLAQQEIGTLFQQHMKSYMGSAVLTPPETSRWWMYWGHFRSPFYVYSYASGQLISKTLQAKVRKNPAFIGQVKEFLAAGTSAAPQEIFSRLGIDITDRKFWQDGMRSIARRLSQAEALAKKLKYKL